MIGTREHLVQVFERLKVSPKDIDVISEGFLFALRHMLRHPFALHTTGSLALQAGMYADAFQKEFERRLGATPEDYLVEARLQYAHQKLLSTNLSVKDIATKIGFRPASEFSRLYIARFGQTPTQTRYHLKRKADPLGAPDEGRCSGLVSVR